DDERWLFRQLSVFAAGVDIDAAERIAAERDTDPGTALAPRVDASMINADFGGATRYRMLETLRAYGLDRLAAAGEADAAGERFVAWAVGLAEWIQAGLCTEREPEADAVLRRELGNLRAAVRRTRTGGALVAAGAIGTAQVAAHYRDRAVV